MPSAVPRVRRALAPMASQLGRFGLVQHRPDVDVQRGALVVGHFADVALVQLGLIVFHDLLGIGQVA